MQENSSLVGRTLGGRFEVLGELGVDRGCAMYVARQIAGGREVSLRIFPPTIARDAERVETCLRDMRGAVALRHPTTATTFAYGKTDSGLLWAATELLRGEPLNEIILREGRLSLEHAAYVTGEICSSLTEAHAIGIIHGSLASNNVVLEDRGDEPPRVRVRDYGLSGVLSGDERADEIHSGALDYRDYESPEASDGEEANDARSDIYSLGVLLFEMLTGRFDDATRARAASLWEVQSSVEIPMAVDALLAAALARSPDGRLPSAGIFRERMEAAVARMTQDARRTRVRKLSEYRRLAEASDVALGLTSAQIVGGAGQAEDSAPSTPPPVKLRRHSRKRIAVLALTGSIVVVAEFRRQTGRR